MPFDPEQQTPKNPNLRHVIAPERSSGVSAPSYEPGQQPEKKKSKKGLAIGLGSGVAGAALVAASIMGINTIAGALDRNPTAEAPVDPSEPTETDPEEQPTSPELTVEQIEIPAGLSVEQVGQAIIERFDDWRNAGSNDPVIRDQVTDAIFTIGAEAFIQAKAEEYAELYAAALYVEDWRSRADLVRNYDFGVRVNYNTLTFNVATQNPAENPADLEPFKRNIHFESAREISSGDGTRVIEVDFTETTNADKNRVGEQLAPGYADFEQGVGGRFVFTLVTVGGSERIAANEIYDR